MDEDGDQIMNSATNSQFTQSLLLFVRLQILLILSALHSTWDAYTPHLTQFYASIGPTLLMQFVHETLETFDVRCKVGSPKEDPDGTITYRLRIHVGGFDRGKVMFKDWVEVEAFSYRGHKGECGCRPLDFRIRN